MYCTLTRIAMDKVDWMLCCPYHHQYWADLTEKWLSEMVGKWMVWLAERW